MASAALLAQPSGWTHVQGFTVTNNTTTLATNYQLKLIIDTQTPIGAGEMLANGDDIRFGSDCQGTTLYNYWIESGINTATTTIWVKIDTLGASDSRHVYMYYGNSSATTVSAIPGVFIGPNSSTDSVNTGGPGGVGNSQRGFRFSPNTDVLVTSFGKNEPTGTTRYVTLFNFATQAVVSQLQVGGPAGQYSYGNLASPIWLTQGTQYLLELYQGASDGYYFGTSSQIGQALTYYDMRYCNSCTQNTFPTNTLTNYHYGYPDLWYWTKTSLTVAPTIVPDQPLALNAGPDRAICIYNSIMIGSSATGGSGTYSYNWLPASGLDSTTTAAVTASPGSTTTYTVLVNDGCATLVDSVMVTVHPQPTVAAITMPAAICMGDSAQGMATGSAMTYDWQPGSFTGNIYNIAPTSTTTYTVVGTDVNGCMDTVQTTIVVNPLPVADAGIDAQFCSGLSTTLNGNGPNCSWTPGASLSNPNICNPVASPTVPTVYTLTVTDSNGCSNTDSMLVTVLQNPDVLVAPFGGNLCPGSGASDTLVATATGGSPGYTYLWTPTMNTSSMIIVSPSTSTCYTVTATDANGCVGTNTSCVTVYPPVTIAATSNPQSICAGDSAQVMATGTSMSYVWSPSASLTSPTGNVVGASPSSTTTYTVVGTDSNGCMDSTTATLTVNPLPIVSFSPPASFCVTDGSITLTGTPSGGTFSGPGVTGSTFNPNAAGVGTHPLTYSYTDGNSCSASDVGIVTVSACVGIAPVNGTNGFSVMPNPFDNRLDLRFGNMTGTVTIEVTNALGQLILTQEVNDTHLEIATEQWASGVYWIKFRAADRTATEKIIKR